MPDEHEPKPVFESRTIAVNLIILLSPLYPPAGAWVQAHPNETLALLGIVNILLRFISHRRIVLFR